MQQLLKLFPKPARYAGIETGAIRKNPRDMKLHVALAFPDTYEVGMSYLGQKILYAIANARPHWLAERVMAPEKEACQILRQRRAPLATLETDTPLKNLDAVCFSVTHELCFTDILNMLDLGDIPLRTKDRPDDLSLCPVIMAGGGAMLGAEPLSPFIDLVSLGDGEEQFPEILALLETARHNRWGRKEFLQQARHIPGVYIPSFFEPDANGRLRPLFEDHKPTRRIVSDLNAAPYPTSQVVPIGAVHERLSLEIARGCTRGCRFCHAGMVYRPVRERDPAKIQELIDLCLASTGFDEVSFLALSAGDCTALKTICENAYDKCRREQTTLALPSQRAGSVDDDIMTKMAGLRRAGCTLAPEAGSQRLRDVINKGITENDFLTHVAKLLEHGWRHVKLYFMIGLPTETDDDLLAIADLCLKARDAGGRGAPRMQITASISPFVPKPFTPFQWEAQISPGEMQRRIDLLRTAFKGKKGLKLKWHEPAASHLEGILSRGDRRLADVVEKAFEKGAYFCSWVESFSLEPWLEALAECNLAPEDYTGSLTPGEPLPWSHINAGIHENFLLRERQRALAAKTTSDCRSGACHNCGACDTKASPSLLAGDAPINHKLVFEQRDQEAHKPSLDADGRLKLRDCASNPPDLARFLCQKATLLRCWHLKSGLHAYLSHLELQTVLMRAFRRAGVPVAFSQGFHPLPLISFGRALPVGTESLAEWFTIWLRTHISPTRLTAQLNAHLDSGLQIYNSEAVTQRAELSIAETYRIELPPETNILQAAGAFGNFSDQTETELIRQTKKGEKRENIRPYLLNWRVCVDASGTGSIIMNTDWSTGYLSPARLAAAILAPLGLETDQIGLTKLKQTFASGREYGSDQMPQHARPAQHIDNACAGLTQLTR